MHRSPKYGAFLVTGALVGVALAVVSGLMGTGDGSMGTGQLIGYVGTTGNAPRDTPHLHFAIIKMTDDKHWWQGTAIDPYSVLK